MGGRSYVDADLLWIPDRSPHSRLSYWGAPQTIEVMGNAILDDAKHFETRQLAETVCEGLDSKDYTSEYVALYNFVLQHTRYMRDPRRTELVRAPYIIARMIMEGRRPSVDCDDLSTFIGALVLCVGGGASLVTVAFAKMMYQGEIQYSHVFPTAQEPRTRTPIVLDPVAAEKTQQMLDRVKAARVWPIA